MNISWYIVLSSLLFATGVLGILISTELNPPLKFLQPRQHVELSLSDAEQLGLSNGDAVDVSQNGATVRAQVAIRERVQEGICFLIEGTSEDNANGLLNGSPVSVTIEKTAG